MPSHLLSKQMDADMWFDTSWNILKVGVWKCSAFCFLAISSGAQELIPGSMLRVLSWPGSAENDVGCLILSDLCKANTLTTELSLLPKYLDD